MVTPQWGLSELHLIGVHFVISDGLNHPKGLLLAASRHGIWHLCNPKYCPPLTPTAPTTQPSANPQIYFRTRVFVLQPSFTNICGSLPDYGLWWLFFSPCITILNPDLELYCITICLSP